MAVRRVRVLKRWPGGKTEGRGEIMARLLEETPRINPEKERFFAELINKRESGRLSEAEFIEKLAIMKKEEEQRPKKRSRGEINLGSKNSFIKIRKWKEELKILNKHK